MSYEICIRVDDDGKISVGVEKGGEQGPMMGKGGEQGAAMMGGEADYKPVESIKDALMTVMDIYSNEGEMGAGEDEFNAGYGEGPATEAPIREQDDEERM